MLLGEYHHSIDPKRRISIPAKFREVIGGEIIIVKNIRKNCLNFYSIPVWEKYLESLKVLDYEKREQIHWWYMRDAVRSLPDSLGRMSLTEGLLKRMEIDFADESDRNIVLVGCDDFGEIWSEKLYSKRTIDLDSLIAAMDAHGI